ncbi:Ubiquitin domain protein [Kalmanozyma brasiliensis GHG001]|uniref:Ubiquitin carboxyl-terminal hydrolase n=1 Tax=Kalmanozyma brasiliensis (strain GHG001) TaxID=1365824 RepID=V5EUN2_KALBG|nr:Ubiquitin domain protein [Kalmanozyma brasiliensis GHG001]EST05854.1 Ubiquitin domain protein [Kalmanozyma brasiliensis GHG001]
MASTIPIKVKHNGKLHDIQLDPSQPATAFKQAIYEKTGVPSDRMKVMVKGGMLKDDHDLTKIGARPGQTFMVIGTAGELPKAPTGPITFIEDLTDSELALATKSRVGLTNLGNTCYLNSTLQVLRAIPELQTALGHFDGNLGGADGERNLTAALRDLYKNLSQTTEPFPPFAFLTILRQVAPQFAEMTRDGHGFAQQDAEEVWVRIVQALQNSLHGLAPSSEAGADASRKFVEQYLTGHMVIKRSSAEAPDEPASLSKDPFSILQCNISSTTNEMSSGILDSLNQQIEKTSSSLNRTAVYDETSRIDRLPAYLATHFVRFYWRRDINKKTKIMRKVKFPFVLDATPFLTDELKAKVKETNVTIQKIEKDRDERAKIRKRAVARRVAEEKAAREAKAGAPQEDVAMTDATTAPSTEGEGKEDSKLGQALSEEEELAERAKERETIRSTIHPDLLADTGCNPSALYELVGVVTHKGAAADAGHYISWVRRDLEEETEHALAGSPAKGKNKEKLDKTEADEEWYKFDDDKVSLVGRDKITALDGGGEDSVAYILLYRSKQL